MKLEEVPADELRHVWEDTTVAGATWERPIYDEERMSDTRTPIPSGGSYARVGTEPARAVGRDPTPTISALSGAGSPARSAYNPASSRSEQRGSESMPLTAGTRLGSYGVVALLRSGGMGEGYRAND